eukprot:scaffold204285_cov21-Tisochrysis_lutea.AAC.1
MATAYGTLARATMCGVFLWRLFPLLQVAGKMQQELAAPRCSHLCSDTGGPDALHIVHGATRLAYSEAAEGGIASGISKLIDFHSILVNTRLACSEAAKGGNASGMSKPFDFNIILVMTPGFTAVRQQ